jgi:Rieske 2Fe-2S family protein
MYATSDHAILPRFTPVGPELTDVEFTWLVDKDAVEGVDYNVDRLTFVWRITTEQDKKIVDDNQAGVNSIAYEPGPYSEVEQGLVRFNAWYLMQIGP